MSSKQRTLRQRARTFAASIPPELLVQPARKTSGSAFRDDLLPFELYRETRANVERVADQINKSFTYGIFDGCAVLMRRLIEMLLILAFNHHAVDSEIRKANGDYVQLSEIIAKALSNRSLDLSRNAKEYLDVFREKGNLAAHNPFHNARKKDLELVQPKFRHLVEELLYKAGISS